MSRYLVVALDRDLRPGPSIGVEKVDGMILVHSGDQMARVMRVVTVVPGEALEQRLDAITRSDDRKQDAAMTDDVLEAYHASCIAEWVALLWEWPVCWGDEPVTTQIEKYETRIARAEQQIRFYRGMAASAIKPEHRASYAASADSLEALTARHRVKLAALRGDGVEQRTIFDAA